MDSYLITGVVIGATLRFVIYVLCTALPKKVSSFGVMRRLPVAYLILCTVLLFLVYPMFAMVPYLDKLPGPERICIAALFAQAVPLRIKPFIPKKLYQKYLANARKTLVPFLPLSFQQAIEGEYNRTIIGVMKKDVLKMIPAIHEAYELEKNNIARKAKAEGWSEESAFLLLEVLDPRIKLRLMATFVGCPETHNMLSGIVSGKLHLVPGMPRLLYDRRSYLEPGDRQDSVLNGSIIQLHARRSIDHPDVLAYVLGKIPGPPCFEVSRSVTV
ncbi:MAG: hypothetical protein ABSH28_17725 [Acidobacteriota bacterium]